MSDTPLMTRRQAACATALGALAVALPALADAKPADAKPAGDTLAVLQKVIVAHNDAFTSQNLKGVLETMSPKAVLMGTAPGELWVGHVEITDAYRHFFQNFDAGKQRFTYLYHEGRIGPSTGWLVGVSKVTLHKGGKQVELGMNTSATFEKIGGKWLITSMHFSHLTRAKA